MQKKRPSKPKNTKFSKKEGKQNSFGREVRRDRSAKNLPKFDGTTRLNKFISNAGICSRREADTLIKTGVVSVNGKVVTEMGYKVKDGDVVKYGDETISQETKRYILLNKPKDFLTTLHEDKTKKTVMNLIRGACKEQVFPIGKLNKHTTGVFLFTNDGDMALKLTNQKLKVHKVFHVFLDQRVSQDHLNQMQEGVTIGNAIIKAEKAAYVGNDKTQIGIEILSNKSNAVPKLFEVLGYKVTKIDRVSFGVVTKKDLPRGRWRFLTESEVAFLKKVK